jgi:hypothetical protein
MRRRLFLALGLALLAGCATPPAPVVAPAGVPLAELEPLYGLEAGREAITLSVGSNGCTRKEDFVFYVQREAGAVKLAFARKRLDPCRSFAMGRTTVRFTYDELGLDARAPTFLLNPFIAWTGPGQ